MNTKDGRFLFQFEVKKHWFGRVETERSQAIVQTREDAEKYIAEMNDYWSKDKCGENRYCEFRLI